SVGISQFHRLITTKLRTAMETTASATNAAPFTTQRPRPLTTSSSPRLPIRCRQSTDFGARQPLVPDRSQPLLQIEHRVALAREQRVETHSRARRQLLEADALDLVRYEYLALLRRQLRARPPAPTAASAGRPAPARRAPPATRPPPRRRRRSTRESRRGGARARAAPSRQSRGPGRRGSSEERAQHPSVCKDARTGWILWRLAATGLTPHFFHCDCSARVPERPSTVPATMPQRGGRATSSCAA